MREAGTRLDTAHEVSGDRMAETRLGAIGMILE
jgi:hypothetical protein